MNRVRGFLKSLGALAILVAGLTGCYEHVVRADGASTGQYQVYKPNLKEDDAASIDKLKSQARADKKAPNKTIETKPAP